MSTQALNSGSLICAERSQRRGALVSGDATAFRTGMRDALRRELARGELLALPAMDATLLCLEGELWLTRDGDQEDYILGAGSTLHLRAADQDMVQALRASRIRLIAA